MSLKNKVAIVTGSSSGIGAVIAKKFAEEGAQVTIVGRNGTKLANVAIEIEKIGTKPLSIIGDVSKDEDAKRIVADTLKHFGKLDILVNNAGIARDATILDRDPAKTMKAFDEVIGTNLRAAVHLTNLVAPFLVETKGNIINISSINALHVLSPNTFIYNTSKAGLDHFTRSVALDLAPKGVRVNTINPGPVKKDIIDKATADATWENIKKITALDRIADAVEIADLAVFIASDKGKSITGSSIVSDNGTLLKN